MSADSPPPTLPARIGKYEVEQEMGRGASSIVYRARDPILNRVVALKVLPHYLAADPAFRSRFLREARVVARLQSPYIVPIFDFGVAEDNAYIAMEFIDGSSLNKTIRATPAGLPVTRAVDIVMQVAQALEEAHSQGIVHRDVKPGNVLVGASGRAYLTDFGIALAASGSEATTATTGAIMGTPGYIAPEIIRGGRADHRADLFSLGTLAYALLTGKNPFEEAGGTPVSALFRTMGAPPPAPSSVRPGVPTDLDAIVLKALAVDPAVRFQSAAAFISELGRFTGQLSVEDSWPSWKAAIATALLKHGEVHPGDLEHAIPPSHRQYAMERFVRESTALQLRATDVGGLALARARLVQELNAAWTALEAWSLSAPPLSELVLAAGTHPPSNELSDLLLHVVQSLAQGLATTITPLGGEQLGVDLFPTAFALDTRAAFTGTNLPGHVPILFTVRGTLEESDVTTIRTLLGRLPFGGHRFAILLVVGAEPAIADARARCDALRRLHGYDVVVLGIRDLVGVLAAREPARALRKLVFAQVNLTTVSPFVTNGPVPYHVFFGREAILHGIAEEARGKSFAIVGGRRIGKSSLLARLHNDRLPDRGFRTLYHDCSVTPSYEAFLQARAASWQPPQAADARSIEDVLDQPPGDRPLVVLLDEADKLVVEDRRRGWPLFLRLRAAAHAGRAQFVFCGERGLAEAMKESGGPLFNYASRINLGRLDHRAVEELVKVPMAQMEIDLVDPSAIVNLVWRHTSGHPNVVQRLCRRLVERLNDRADDRAITPDDVRTVVNEPAFLEEDFLETYWERATALERIISILMAHEERPYPLMEVMAMLGVHGLVASAGVVKDALDRLVELRCLLQRARDGYEFAVESFPWVVSRAATTEDLLLVLKSQYAEESREGAS